LPRLNLPLVGELQAEEPEVPLCTGDFQADMLLVSRGKLADKITGGLSKPGKMPCYSWGLSAWPCRAGSRLRQQEGTFCLPNVCYAKNATMRV